jgi:integrase
LATFLARAKYGFCSARAVATQTGEPLEVRLLARRYFKPILKAAGLPSIRPYDRRHISATIDGEAGTSIKAISARLGHSTSKTTLDTYSHMLPDTRSIAAKRLDDVLYEGTDRVQEPPREVGVELNETRPIGGFVLT